jgi:hypothetical protein
LLIVFSEEGRSAGTRPRAPSPIAREEVGRPIYVAGVVAGGEEEDAAGEEEDAGGPGWGGWGGGAPPRRGLVV